MKKKRRRKRRGIRDAAAVKATGGGGYKFADEVAAHFLIELLHGGTPLGSHAGSLTEIHFEVRESGWLLDDLLLVAKSGAETTRCAISVKSNVRLSISGLDTEFVSDAWNQWGGVEGSTFDREKDYLGLATIPSAISVTRDWNALIVEARGTSPDRFGLREKGKKGLSKAKIRMLDSLRLPAEPANNTKRISSETARLLARLCVFQFDFDSATSDSRERDIGRCRDIVSSGTLEHAELLRNLLMSLAADARTTGDYFDIPKLVRRLGHAVELKDFPDHRKDWEVLDKRAQGNMAEIRVVVGNDIHLERLEEEKLLVNALSSSGCKAVVGDSGSGKSGTLVTVLRRLSIFRHVVWLNAQELSRASQGDLARTLGLRHELPDLLDASKAARYVLVLDGFEQLHREARERALELARMVSKAGDDWTILLTVQSDGYSAAKRDLLDVGINEIEKIEFANPAPIQILERIKTLRGVSSLFLRSELQPILCNLATLHWVIQIGRDRSLESSRTWIGETEVIEWIWTRWVGDDASKHVRGFALRRLGENEGERISGAVLFYTIDIQELRVLGDLEKEGVVRFSESTVKFSHDLSGDWARLQSLVASGADAANRIREKAGVPRWGRAIRLYAQRLVEREEGLGAWKNFVAGFSTEDPRDKLASNLFLDGILFAANVEPLLERVWTELIAERGAILRQLLQRIVTVATVPDLRYQNEVSPEDADLAAAWFRIPRPLYWVPVLRTLERHVDDVAKEGIFEAATVCELWLRTIPVEFPGRPEAGRVALALAREVQGRRAEGVIFVGNADGVICQALLQASPEYPDEVSQVVLELCGRRDEDPAITRRATDAAEARSQREKERQNHAKGTKRKSSNFPIGLPSSWGPTRLAGPDGPKHRVSEGLRSAVLDTNALDALVSVRPQIAREVILAVCLDEPRQKSDYERHSFSLPGFAYWREGAPPMYWKGAFYRFLRSAPAEALDAIVSLVNFATDRWLEKGLGREPSAGDRRIFSLEFVLPSKTVHLVGDGQVFAWSRWGTNTPEIVECALMALEKWLYDSIEKKESVDAWIDTILEKNTSLAIAGVLLSVGLKGPHLFTGILRPLLGNWLVYQWQLSIASQEQPSFWALKLSAWADKGAKAFNLARDWHAMPHRRAFLQDMAVDLMLFDEPSKEYFKERREHWARELASLQNGKDRERLEFFLARMDPNSYILTDMGEKGVQVEPRFPARLEEQSRQVADSNSLNLFILRLPGAARTLLVQGQRDKKEGELDAFVRSLRRAADADESALKDSFVKSQKMEAVAAGIAVLVVLHRDWLSKHPEIETWCLEMLRTVAAIPRGAFSPGLDELNTGIEGFIGQAALVLSLEGRDEWIARAVASGVTSNHYPSTFHVLTTAYRERERLGRQFLRLQNLVVLWAAIRRSSVYVFRADDNESVLGRWREMLIQRYLKERDGDAAIPLTTADRIGKRLLRRRERKNEYERLRRAADREKSRLHRETAGLDLEVLRKGFGFLSEMTLLALENERSELLIRCQDLLQFALGMLPEAPSGDVDVDIEGSLYEFDYWVFSQIASVMIGGVSLSEAQRLWEPILRLPVAAHIWVRAFLEQWFRVGLAEDTKNFEPIWSEMITHVLNSTTWSPDSKYGWYHVHDVVAELMGMRSARETLGQAKFIPLVERMTPLYERWMSRWIKEADLATSVAYFLSTDSGAVLIPQGMRHLAGAVPSFDASDWRRERLTDGLSASVRACWKKYRDQMRSDPPFWTAFLTVLNALCARQDAVALSIQAEVARSST